MYLLRNPKTRAEMWNAKTLNTRWSVRITSPVSNVKDVALHSSEYTVSYDTMIRVYDSLGFGQVDSIPDYVKFTKDATELNYADEHLPFRKGCYATACKDNRDSRKLILRILKVSDWHTLPSTITIERMD